MLELDMIRSFETEKIQKTEEINKMIRNETRNCSSE